VSQNVVIAAQVQDAEKALLRSDGTVLCRVLNTNIREHLFSDVR
jgi:hypothetical protein